MKEFFEEYGGVALGVLALILLIVMITPLKNTINFSLKDTVKAATQKAEKQDKMAADPTVENLNPNHTVYPIIYDTLGGNSISSTEGWHLPNEFSAPVKSGYKFLGWWRDNAFTKKVVAGEQIGGPTTLYAKWDPIDYAISYNLDGGTMSGETTSYNVETPSFALPIPAKEGSTFLGWTGSNGSTPQTNVMVSAGSTGNKDYTANWANNQYTYNVRYFSSSGKSLGSTTYTENHGTSKTITPPTKIGYNTPAVKEVVWDSATAKTIDFTYDLITYSISYYTAGGTISGQKTSYTVEDSSFTIPTPVRAGYDFLGWTGSNGGVAQTNVTVNVGLTSDLNYTANWKIKKTLSTVWRPSCSSAFGSGNSKTQYKITYSKNEYISQNCIRQEPKYCYEAKNNPLCKTSSGGVACCTGISYSSPLWTRSYTNETTKNRLISQARSSCVTYSTNGSSTNGNVICYGCNSGNYQCGTQPVSYDCSYWSCNAGTKYTTNWQDSSAYPNQSCDAGISSTRTMHQCYVQKFDYSESELSTVNISKFSGGTYSIKVGPNMTWGEWVDSEYNTEGFYLENNTKVKTPLDMRIDIPKNGDCAVAFADTIIDPSYTGYGEGSGPC